MFPKVLILTLLIFGTFAKDSNENVEERIEALERKLAVLTMTNEMEDIGTNRGVLTNFVSVWFSHLKLHYLKKRCLQTDRQGNHCSKIFHFWQENKMTSIVNSAIKPVTEDVTDMKNALEVRNNQKSAKSGYSQSHYFFTFYRSWMQK